MVPSVVPQVQSVVPSVVPQVQSVVPSVVPQVQSVVPSVVPQVQSVVPSVVPTAMPMVPQVPVTPYVQPIGSRHPIEQNHLGLGLAPGSFNTLGGSPYGRISQIAPATGLAATTLKFLEMPAKELEPTKKIFAESLPVPLTQKEL